MRKHLELYEQPSHYIGEAYFGTYPIYAKTRDSSLLEESNFDAILNGLQDAALKANAPDSTLIVSRASHWAVGWVETIYLDANAPDSLLDLANDVLESLAQYPVLNEEDYSFRQTEAVNDYWNHANERERAELMNAAGDGDGEPDRVFDYLAEMFG